MRFVIKFTDVNMYNQGLGFMVGPDNATRYDTWQQAKDVTEGLDGPMKIMPEPPKSVYNEYEAYQGELPEEVDRIMTPAIQQVLDLFEKKGYRLREATWLMSGLVQVLSSERILQRTLAARTEDTNGKAINRWLDKHREETVAKYPDEFIAVHLDRGVVAHSKVQEGFEDLLVNFTQEERQTFHLLHTSTLT